ncbi:hypothetical protein ACFWP7_25095 [Streptomyces sp. NPDC058470]|uniref:hypothetical protein n=1 Tax=Streptomyces sp. NPDC058470 TaxID=3346515 RepID=UPI00366446E3
MTGAAGKDYGLGVVGGSQVDSDTVTAISATAIALGSLWVSFSQTRATRLHNRQSVRPLLEMRRIGGYEDHNAGLQVINAGLGPAVVTDTVVRLDGEDIGPWNRSTQHRIKAALPAWPLTYSLRPGAALLAGQSVFLIHLEQFSEDEHGWFSDLIAQRLVIEIHYESLYGGEDFEVTTTPY